MDLAIINGTIVTREKIYNLDIGIKGGKIAVIGKKIKARRTIDANGKYILPGAIDAHVHLQTQVGNTISSDDFETGTIAAACGGTTTIIDFAESEEKLPISEILERRLKEAYGKAVIDYGLHISITNSDSKILDEIPKMIDFGCTSFKIYMAYKGIMLRDDEICKVFDYIRHFGGLPIIHAENHLVTKFLTQKFFKEGKIEPKFHPLTKPAVMEGEATGRIISLAEIRKVPVYIVHVSCKQALEKVKDARDRNLIVYAETCPQYLILSAELYNQNNFEGAKYVMSPPLRNKYHQEALWKGIVSEDIQIISTDHCPFFFKGQKDLGKNFFADIPGGVPGIETRFSLLYHFGFKKGKISLNRLVDICCTNPAKIFGLYPQKGTINIGSDADIVIIDPKKEATLSIDILHQNVDYTPYAGIKLIGYPVYTISRGEVIVENNKFIGKKGRGKFLKRKL